MLTSAVKSSGEHRGAPGFAGLLLVLGAFAGLLAFHFDVVPFWDAKSYTFCVENAVQQRFDLLNFRCFGHPSIAYVALLAPTQYLWPWTPPLLYLVDALIGIASIVAFDRLVDLAFGAPRAERALLTGLYALAPLFVVHAVFIDVDFPATAFFVLFLYALFAGRTAWIAATAVFLIFSKETGAAAWALATIAYTTVFVLRPDRPWSDRLGTFRRRWPAVAVPMGAAALYLVYVRIHAPQETLGYATVPVGLISNWSRTILDTNLADPGMRSFLADIFVLNFQWLYTSVIAAAAITAAIRVRPTIATDEHARRTTMFLAIVLIGLLYVTTRWRTYNNARYVLLASPVLILMAYDALRRLTTSAFVRVGYLCATLALVVSSNVRTLDVLSRAIFGTIPFGSHRLLDMASLVGGVRADSLVYNFEYAQFQYLYEDAMRDVKPHVGAVVLIGSVLWNFPPDIDRETYAASAKPSRALPLVTSGRLEPHLGRDGELFYFVQFPNTTEDDLNRLRRQYEVTAMKRYERRGYAIDVYTFRYRAS